MVGRAVEMEAGRDSPMDPLPRDRSTGLPLPGRSTAHPLPDSQVDHPLTKTFHQSSIMIRDHPLPVREGTNPHQTTSGRGHHLNAQSITGLRRINIFLAPLHRLEGVNSPPLLEDQSAHLIGSLIPLQEQPIFPQNTFRMELEVTLTMDICHQGDDLLLSTMDQSDKSHQLATMIVAGLPKSPLQIP